MIQGDNQQVDEVAEAVQPNSASLAERQLDRGNDEGGLIPVAEAAGGDPGEFRSAFNRKREHGVLVAKRHNGHPSQIGLAQC
jgi:hypothetical protein